MRRAPSRDHEATKTRRKHEEDLFSSSCTFVIFVLSWLHFFLTARQQPALGGNGYRLRAIVGAELVEDRRHVELDGPL